MKQSNVWCLVGFVLGCAPEMVENRPVHDAEPPKLLARRVSAVVKREAAALVHLSTEHEAFITTPEHPFATHQSGWIGAGQLAPGDRVVSARFGTVRVLSLHREKPLHPVPVFNLSVDGSHAYLVGTDQILVHNTSCKDTRGPLEEKNEELSEAQRQLEALQRTTATSPEHEAELEQQISNLQSKIKRLKQSIYNARWRQKKAERAADPTQPPAEDTLTRRTRELEALEGEIEVLKADLPSAQDKAAIQKRLDELARERRTVKKRLADLHRDERIRRGEYVPKQEHRLNLAVAEYESAKNALEATQSALRELEAQARRSDAEPETIRTRRVALERRLKAQQLDHDAASRILTWERQLAELERTRTIEGESPALEREESELRAKLNDEKHRTRSRNSKRKEAADPEQKEALREAKKQREQRTFRRAAYVADPERPRDTLELMQEELAALREQPASVSRDQQIADITNRVETATKLVEIRRKMQRTKLALSRARGQRRELTGQGEDTTKIDRTIARLEQEKVAQAAERNKLRAHALLLGLEGARRRKAPQRIDEARFRALERDLAEPATIADPRLRELEREVIEIVRDEPDTLDAEFLEQLGREAGTNDAAIQETVRDEAEDVAAALLALAESLRTSPSPEREAAVASSLRALQNELREERSAVEAADFTLANEHAFLSQTLARPGSSRRAADTQRLKALEEQRTQLRTDWRQRMQRRLDDARRELRTMQNTANPRDETAEAELARKIALLEYEVKTPAF